MEKHFSILQSKTEASKMSGADRKGEKSDDRQMRQKQKQKQDPQRFHCFVLDFYFCL